MNDMKKLMMAAAALCCMTMAVVLTACKDDDDPVVPTSGNAVITVNTGTLYDELNITDLMPKWLDDGTLSIVDTLLIYKSDSLVMKLGTETSTIQPLTFEAKDLPNGTYTLVLWQTTHNVSDGRNAWLVSGEEKLSTVSISTPYTAFYYTRALGYATTTVTVDGGNIQASLSPKAMGSIVELRVDNLTEDKGYKSVSLRGGNDQYVIGCRLDPSLAEEDRWIMEREHNWYEEIGKFNVGTNSYKFFTLTHGDDILFDLYGVKEDGSLDFLLDGFSKLGIGENILYYFDLDRLSYQPTYFGSYEGFTAWKAERDKGIIVLDPYLVWGSSIDKVYEHIDAKLWWDWGNDKLELWEGLGWHRWYYIARSLTEQYLFETEDGQNLHFVVSICHDPKVPIEIATNTILKQGYEYRGKIVYPNQDPCDIFFSADGQTEVQTATWDDGRWEVYYQPTDPEDLQYIVPANEAAPRSIAKRSPMHSPLQVPTAWSVKKSKTRILSPNVDEQSNDARSLR